MKRSLVMTLLLAISVSMLRAQTATIEGVRRSAVRTSDAIKEGTDVKGYYFFYVSDKVDKKTNAYTLRIYDDNMKMLKDINFEESKDIEILESSFNGTDLIFLFYNDKEKTFDYQVYGADGKKKSFNYMRELSKKEKRYLEMTYLANNNDGDETYKGLYPIEGKGFISNMPSREDKDYTVQIDFFSTEKRKQWTYTPTEDAKKTVGDYLGYHNGVVYFEMLKFNSMMDQKPDSYILGLSLETGKKLFEVSTDQKYKFYPVSLSVLADGKAYLYGEYFDLNDNIMKDKSSGFAFWGIDEKGKITSEKYNSWDLEMGKHLDVNSKGKIADFGYMYLHNILQTADGSIYAIGEGFKKEADALGIASKILSGGRSRAGVLKVRVTDMILLKFDQGFNLKEAKVYDKNSNVIHLSSGYDFVSLPLLGKMMKYQYGGFDYAYLQTNKDVSSFTVCYSDYVRSKEYKGSTFNSISYTDGKITTDKVNTKSKATFSWILPAKQGQILILDYERKEKRVYMHLEKLN